jgi:uncharacterized protein
VTVNRAQRMGDVETETRGLLEKLDDLHKGFDSGPAWYWIIDLAAILLSLSALTGMVTLVSLRARRRSGFIVAASLLFDSTSSAESRPVRRCSGDR